MDLKSKPFYINKEETEWVQNTLFGMSLSDKIKQLFIDMAAPVSDEIIKKIVRERKIG